MNDATYPSEPMMTGLFADVFDLAARLDAKRTAPPAPLPRHHDRDGPQRTLEPLAPHPRGTGAQNAPQRPSANRGIWHSDFQGGK